MLDRPADVAVTALPDADLLEGAKNTDAIPPAEMFVDTAIPDGSRERPIFDSGPMPDEYYGDLTQNLQPEPEPEAPQTFGSKALDTAKMLGGGGLKATGSVLGLGEWAIDTLDDDADGRTTLDMNENWLARQLQKGDDWFQNAGLALEGSADQRSQDAAAASQIEGDIWNPMSVEVGDDASAFGFVLNFANALGSIAPIALAGALTGGLGAAAAGGAMVAEEQITSSDDFLKELRDNGELEEQVPLYAALIKTGMSEQDAYDETRLAAQKYVGVASFALGAAGGKMTDVVLKGRGPQLIGKLRDTLRTSATRGAASKSGIVSRVSQSTLVGALEEGAQEVAEPYVGAQAMNAAIGTEEAGLDNTLGNFLMGAMVGGAVGTVGGLRSPGEGEEAARDTVPVVQPDADLAAGAAQALNKTDPDAEAAAAAAIAGLDPEQVPEPEEAPAEPVAPANTNTAPDEAIPTEQPANQPGAPTGSLVPEPEPEPEPEPAPALDVNPEEMQQPEAEPEPDKAVEAEQLQADQQVTVPTFDADGNYTGEDVVAPIAEADEDAPLTDLEQEEADAAKALANRPKAAKPREEAIRKKLGTKGAENLKSLYSGDDVEVTVDGETQVLTPSKIIDLTNDFLNTASRATRASGDQDTGLLIANLRGPAEEFLRDSDVLTEKSALDLATAMAAVAKAGPKEAKAIQLLKNADPATLLQYMADATAEIEASLADVDIPTPSDAGEPEKRRVSGGENLMRFINRENAKGMPGHEISKALYSDTNANIEKVRENLSFEEQVALEQANDAEGFGEVTLENYKDMGLADVVEGTSPEAMQRSINRINSSRRDSAAILAAGREILSDDAIKALSDMFSKYEEVVDGVGQLPGTGGLKYGNQKRVVQTAPKTGQYKKLREVVRQRLKSWNAVSVVELTADGQKDRSAIPGKEAEFEAAQDAVEAALLDLRKFEKGAGLDRAAKVEATAREIEADTLDYDKRAARMEKEARAIEANRSKLETAEQTKERNEKAATTVSREAAFHNILKRDGLPAPRGITDATRDDVIEAIEKDIAANKVAQKRAESTGGSKVRDAASAPGKDLTAVNAINDQIAEVTAEDSRVTQEQRAAFKANKAAEEALQEAEKWVATDNPTRKFASKKLAESQNPNSQIVQSNPDAVPDLKRAKEQAQAHFDITSSTGKGLREQIKQLKVSLTEAQAALRAEERTAARLLQHREKGVRLAQELKDAKAYSDAAYAEAKAEVWRKFVEGESVKRDIVAEEAVRQEAKARADEEAKARKQEAAADDMTTAQAAEADKQKTGKYAHGKKKSEQDKFKTPKARKLIQALKKFTHGKEKPRGKRAMDVALTSANNAKTFRPGRYIWVEIPKTIPSLNKDGSIDKTKPGIPREEEYGSQQYMPVYGGQPKIDRSKGVGSTKRFAPKVNAEGRPYFTYDQIEIGRARDRGQLYRTGVGGRRIAADVKDIHASERLFDPRDIDQLVSVLYEDGLIDPETPGGDARMLAEWLAANRMDYREGKATSGKSGTRGGGETIKLPTTPTTPTTPIELDDPVPPVEMTPEEIQRVLAGLLANNPNADPEDRISEYNRLIEVAKAYRDTAAYLDDNVDEVLGRVKLGVSTMTGLQRWSTGFNKLPHKQMFEVKINRAGDTLVGTVLDDGALQMPQNTVEVNAETLESDARALIERDVQDKAAAFRKRADLAEAEAKGIFDGLTADNKPATGTIKAQVEPKQIGQKVDLGVDDVLTGTKSQIPDAPEKAENIDPVDRLPTKTKPLENIPATFKAVDQKELGDVGMTGAVAMANLYDKRMHILDNWDGGTDVSEVTAEKSGFALMDGPGTGKTRQFMAFALHALHRQAERNIRNEANGDAKDVRKILIVAPGSNEFEASTLQQNFATDMMAIAGEDAEVGGVPLFVSNRLGPKLNPALFKVSSQQALLDINNKESFAAAIIDEVHGYFRADASQAGQKLNTLNADFKVFSSATIANRAGEENYIFAALDAQPGETYAAARRRVAQRMGAQRDSQKGRYYVPDTPAAREQYEASSQAILRQAQADGSIVSRQLVQQQETQVLRINPDEKVARLIAEADRMQGNDSSTVQIKNAILEYAKIDAAVAVVAADLRAGRQSIVVFKNASGAKFTDNMSPELLALRDADPEFAKLWDEGKNVDNTPIRIFHARLKKVVKDMNKSRPAGERLNANTMFGVYTGTQRKGEPDGVRNFQNGTIKVLAVTEQKAGTGISLHDDGVLFVKPDGTKVRRKNMIPRNMVIINGDPTAIQMEQLLGRHDRRGQISKPWTTFIRIEGSQSDKVFISKAKDNAKFLDKLTGRAAFAADNSEPNDEGEYEFKGTVSLGTPLMQNKDFNRLTPEIAAKQSITDEKVVADLDKKSAQGILADLAEMGPRKQRGAAKRLLKQQGVPDIDVVSFGESDLTAEEKMGRGGVPKLGLIKFDRDGVPTIYINEDGVTQTHTLMHEYVHALTAMGLTNDPSMSGRVQALMSQVEGDLREQFPDAFISPAEFVAEAFSNQEFQQAMKEADSRYGNRTVWQRFIDFLARTFGVTPDLPRSTLEQLAEVTRIEKDSARKYTSQTAYELLPEPLARLEPELSRADAERSLMAARGRGMKEKGFRWLLKTLTFDQIVEQYKKFFHDPQSATNTLENLRSVTEAQAARSTDLQNWYQKEVLNIWKRLAHGDNNVRGKPIGSLDMNAPLGHKGKEGKYTVREVLSELMNYSGVAGVDFSEARDHKTNSILGHTNGGMTKAKTPQPKVKPIKQNAVWDRWKPVYDSLPAEAKAVYTELRDKFAKMKEDEGRITAANYLDAIAPLPGTLSWMDASTAQQQAYLDKLGKSSDAKLRESNTTKDQLKQLRDVLTPGKVGGAYFPLRRFGNFVVTVKAEKHFSSEDDARAYAEENVGASVKEERDGSYTAKLLVVSRFETMVEAERFSNRARKDYGNEATVGEIERAQDGIGVMREGINGQLLESVEKNLRKNIGGDPTTADEVRIQSTLRQLGMAMLDAVPDSSLASSLRPRKGQLGASTDIERMLTTYGYSRSNYVSSLEFSRKVSSAQGAVRKSARDAQAAGGDGAWRSAAVADSLIQRMAKTEEQWMNNTFTQTVSDVGFAYYLVGASYNFFNATQPALVGIPVMSARHNPGKVSMALAGAYRRTSGPVAKKLLKSGGTTFELIKALKGDNLFDKTDYDIVEQIIGKQPPGSRHAKLLRNLVDNNYVDVSMAQDMARLGARSTIKIDKDGRSVQKPQTKADFLREWMRMAPHLIEVMNRSVTGMAAYDLEYNKRLETAKRANNGAAPDAATLADIDAKATAYAVRVIKDSQFIYANWNKPEILQTQAARIAFMFMQHVQHMMYFQLKNFAQLVGPTRSWTERKEAGRALGMFLGMHVAVGGLTYGTPELLKGLTGMFYSFGVAMGWIDEEEEPWDVWVMNSMVELLGPTAGEVAARGLPTMIGMDWGPRVGISNMFMMGTQDTSTKDQKARFVIDNLGGPMASLGLRAWDGMEKIMDGRVADGLVDLAPKVLRDPMNALKMQGGIENTRGIKIANTNEIDWWGYMQKSLGFTSANEAQFRLRRTADFALKRKATERTEAMTTAYRMVVDGYTTPEVYKWIHEWNQKNPNAKRITPATLTKSFKTRLQQSQETVRGRGVSPRKGEERSLWHRINRWENQK